VNEPRSDVGSITGRERYRKASSNVLLHLVLLVLMLALGFVGWIQMAPAAEEGAWAQKAPLPSVR
jgi:cytochrome b561